MSIPPELAVLCHHLSQTAPPRLVQNLDALQRKVLGCGDILSTLDGNLSKADNSTAAAEVHKLKTHVTTLLNGRTPEGRLVATVLIKSMIDVGGWEVLKGAEPWVRGLLGVLAKADSVGVKRLCIITLTKIYTATHDYQSLVREITTPTLPSFVASCLNLIVAKGSSQPRNAPTALIETIFSAFSALVTRHPTIFRPSLKQIKAITALYVAPTESDEGLAPHSLQDSARRLVVLIHQTAPKNTSGEEWGAGIRNLVKLAMSTADHALRAVLEDWESSTGHVSQKINIAEKCQGGGEDGSDLPAWSGVDAGAERLQRLLRLLAEYFRHPTAGAVTIPMTQIEDLLARLLTVAPPATSKINATSIGTRTHPGVLKEEKNALWAALPLIHVEALNVYRTMLERVQSRHLLLAYNALEHMNWVFPSCSYHLEFRLAAYQLLMQVLPLIGLSLPKHLVAGLNPVARACSADCLGESPGRGWKSAESTKKSTNGSAANADTFLSNTTASLISPKDALSSQENILARSLLPLLIEYLPTELMDGYSRASLDRAAVLTHNKDALLSSILSPHIASNGRVMPSLLPHLVRKFGSDPRTETLLRPRFPMLIQQINATSDTVDEDQYYNRDAADDTEMLDITETESQGAGLAFAAPVQPEISVESTGNFTSSVPAQTQSSVWTRSANSTVPEQTSLPLTTSSALLQTKSGEGENFDASQSLSTYPSVPASSEGAIQSAPPPRHIQPDPEQSEDDSDEESVHLVGEMETDSEDE